MRQYPQLEFDLALLRSNADAVISRCRGMGIRVCGVVKGVDGMPEAARVLRAVGAAELGTSRLEQVAKCRAAGVPGPWLLIRIPGLTELPDVVALCETSLQSEWPTLLALEERAKFLRTYSSIWAISSCCFSYAFKAVRWRSSFCITKLLYPPL